MSNLYLSDRVTTMKPSATLGMAQAARELADAGVDVVVMSAGEPDFGTPEIVAKVGITSIEQGKTHYSPVRGNKGMVAAMREKFLRDQKVNYSADEVMCTVGAKAAILLALEAVVNEGDEVIIFAPYWVSYIDQIRLAGGVPVIVPTHAQDNFMPTAVEIKNAITSKTKAMIINSPNNPTGGVISEAQLKALADTLTKSNIWLISDEIYERLLFDDNVHYSPASLSDDMRQRTIVISGVSKAYAMTGWRVGIAAGAKLVIDAMVKLQGQQTTCLPDFIQDAAAFALKEGEEVRASIASMRKAYRERREVAMKLFSKWPQVTIFKPGGAFYLWIDFSQYIGKELHGQTVKDDMDLAVRMLKEAHVASVPGTPFGGSGYLRFSIASSIKDIEKAAERLGKWLS